MFAFQNYTVLCFLFNREIVNFLFIHNESSRTYSLLGDPECSTFLRHQPLEPQFMQTVLRWQCTHKIIICILMKLEIIKKKKSYGLLSTIQRNHLKLQISRINNVSLYQSKKESQVLVT